MLDFLFLGSFSRIRAEGYPRNRSKLLAGLAVFLPACLAPVLAFFQKWRLFWPKTGRFRFTRTHAVFARKSPATPRRAVQNARTKRPVLARVYPARPMPRKTRNAVSRKGPWVRIPNSPPFFCEKRLIGLCLSDAFPLLSRNTRTCEGCFETLFLFSPFSAGENTPKFGEESGEKSAIRSAQGRSA